MNFDRLKKSTSNYAPNDRPKRKNMERKKKKCKSEGGTRYARVHVEYSYHFQFATIYE